MKFKNVWNDAYETMAVNVGNPGEPPVWKKKTVQVRRGLKNRKFAKWDKKEQAYGTQWQSAVGI